MNQEKEETGICSEISMTTSKLLSIKRISKKLYKKVKTLNFSIKAPDQR